MLAHAVCDLIWYVEHIRLLGFVDDVAMSAHVTEKLYHTLGTHEAFRRRMQVVACRGPPAVPWLLFSPLLIDNSKTWSLYYPEDCIVLRIPLPSQAIAAWWLAVVREWMAVKVGLRWRPWMS